MHRIRNSGGRGHSPRVTWAALVAATILIGGCQPGAVGGNAGTQHVNRAGKQDRAPLAASRTGSQPLAGTDKARVMAGSAFFPTSFRGKAPTTPPTNSAAWAAVSDHRASGQALGHFFAALSALESGRRTRPVTILHLGDSHIASDSFSGELRDLFQARFGNAGRGMMMPVGVFRHYRARGIRFSTRGRWQITTALGQSKGPFGLSLARARAKTPDARMALVTTDAAFDWAEVAFVTGPGSGAARITIDGKAREIDTTSRKPGAQYIRLSIPGRKLAISPAGTGPISLASWAVGRNRPGVHYVSLGIPGATALLLERADQWLLAGDLRHLKPDLIVLGYGTNEGFDDALALDRYEKRVAALVSRLRTLAPNASLMIIGPPDAARLPAHARHSSATPCRALSEVERHNYGQRLAVRDARLARWHPPPKLDPVRRTLERIARKAGAGTWDWSKAMGGPCSIHAWVHAEPRLASRDHVHMTTAGYKRSARLLYGAIIAAYAASREVALGE